MASLRLDAGEWLRRFQALSARQRLGWGVAGALMIGWGVYGVAVHPLHRRLTQLREDVRRAEEQLLDAIDATDQAEAIEQAFTAYESYVRPSGSAESELAGVLSEVEAAVRQSGMTLLNLRPAAGRPDAGRTVSVVVDGESTPTQLVRVLDQLQRSSRLLKITQLSVRVSEQKTLRSSLVVSKLLLALRTPQ